MTWLGDIKHILPEDTGPGRLISRTSWFPVFTRVGTTTAGYIWNDDKRVLSCPASSLSSNGFSAIWPLKSSKMHLLPVLTAAILAPIAGLAAPAGDASSVPQFQPLYIRGENLCSLSAPPKLCTPNASVTVEETALRAYQFYRAFVVDGDARTMFSLIDNVYQVRSEFFTEPWAREK